MNNSLRPNLMMIKYEPSKARAYHQAPCGECHLKIGETCDICGATRDGPPKDEPLFPGMTIRSHIVLTAKVFLFILIFIIPTAFALALLFKGK